MNVQVHHSTYKSREYNDKGRFNSFWHQMDEIARLNPASVLEIGTGNGVVNQMLKSDGYNVKSLDFDPELKPDYTGSVTDIPIAENSFEAALCCQVLEHLPYENFITALKEIHRVITGTLVLSLPDLHRVYRFNVQLPRLGEIKFLYTIPRIRPMKWEFNGEHYWNISCEHYPLSRIKEDILKAGFTIERDYCVFEIPWHRFFILKKVSGQKN